MEKLHILMVEDDRLFADIHAEKLRERGFSVTHVTNGDDAMRRLESEQPDLILLDIGLPQRDGFSVLKDIREHEHGAELPVIMLSRLSAKEDIDHAFSLGATEYMIKSQHTPDEVVSHVEKRLANGFTLVEALLVGIVLLILVAIALFQVHIRQNQAIDDAEWVFVHQAQSALLAASQEGNVLVCDGDRALRDCRICTDEACSEEVTDAFLSRDVFSLRDTTFYPEPPTEVCRQSTDTRCEVSVVEETPIDPADASLLFFIRRDRENIEGGEMHILRPNGAVE